MSRNNRTRNGVRMHGQEQGRKALVLQPEVRELLDLVAEELAAEYLRLTRDDREAPREAKE